MKSTDARAAIYYSKKGFEFGFWRWQRILTSVMYLDACRAGNNLSSKSALGFMALMAGDAR